MEIDNENIAVKDHVASFGFIIKWQIKKKLSVVVLPLEFIGTQIEAFYISNSSKF